MALAGRVEMHGAGKSLVFSNGADLRRCTVFGVLLCQSRQSSLQEGMTPVCDRSCRTFSKRMQFGTAGMHAHASCSTSSSLDLSGVPMLLFRHYTPKCCSVKQPTAEGGACVARSDLATRLDAIPCVYT